MNEERTEASRGDQRFEIRLPAAEKRNIFAAAERAGQNPSVWARRTMAAALETAPSEAKGALCDEQAGPAPVPSRDEPRESGTAGDGVRPAAQSRAPARPRRADVGPKPASASRPRPKSKAAKGKP